MYFSPAQYKKLEFRARHREQGEGPDQCPQEEQGKGVIGSEGHEAEP
jgi:hypothetical protein